MLGIVPGAHVHVGAFLAIATQVFSGHTVLLVMCALIFDTYCTRRECDTPLVRNVLSAKFLTAMKLTIYALVGAGIFTIIGTRLHYSLDVLIAVFLAWRCWSGYHSRTLMIPFRDRVTPRMYEGCAFYWAINWLEADSVTKIDTFGYQKAKKRATSVDFESGVDQVGDLAAYSLSSSYSSPRHRSSSEPTKLVPAFALDRKSPRGPKSPRGKRRSRPPVDGEKVKFG